MAAADEVERLYGLDPAEFVAERDAAAKRLRQEGDRAGARVVAGLRRPTAAAGMVNRVVRAAPDRVEELRAAADALTEAAGAGDPAALRAAATREREAVEALVKVARDLDSDLPQQTLQHVRETLHAAAIDPELRDQALSGRLEKEVVAAGLGGLPAAGSLPAPRRRTAAPPARERARPAKAPEPEPAEESAPEKTQRRSAAAEARRQRDAAAAERRARIEDARSARAAAQEARRAARDGVATATRALKEAEAEAERRREQLRDAEAGLAAAEDALAAAEASLDEARKP